MSASPNGSCGSPSRSSPALESVGASQAVTEDINASRPNSTVATSIDNTNTSSVSPSPPSADLSAHDSGGGSPSEPVCGLCNLAASTHPCTVSEAFSPYGPQPTADRDGVTPFYFDLLSTFKRLQRRFLPSRDYLVDPPPPPPPGADSASVADADLAEGIAVQARAARQGLREGTETGALSTAAVVAAVVPMNGEADAAVAAPSEPAEDALTENGASVYELTAEMRGILVNWLEEVSIEFSLQTQTLFLAVAFLEKYLARRRVPRQQLQLLGVTCMFVAAKYEETHPPTVDMFADITAHTYSAGEIIRLELRVLQVLRYDVVAVTAVDFLDAYTRGLGSEMQDPRVLPFAYFLLEISLLSYDLCRMRPSMVAAAALLLAVIVYWHCPGPMVTVIQRLAFESDFENAAELDACIVHLRMAHSQFRDTLTAPFVRYSSPEYAHTAYAPMPGPELFVTCDTLGIA
eukprot:TRINITY_DN2619_c0_g2_i1.p1 TRINITY_DN2619_c0_g2~~TRINITY_DN2619_c0_g2_i1.p1  ORF type:complete len:462 (-),score=81.95 TRINITY_DN2619_c0_g2_i1:208-1593(-)